MAAVAVVTLSGVWATSLQGCDEAYYAQMARGMLQSGDWIVPRYDGTPPLDKPPLLMWLVAASFRMFGVGDLQARLPVLAVGAALPLALFWALPGAEHFRMVAATTLATTLLYVQLQHMVMTDLVAFAGLVAFTLGVLRAKEVAWAYLAGLGLGVAALAKGPLAALFVLATLPYTLAHRDTTLRAGFLLRLVPGLLPAASWYAAMGREFGGRFVDVHLGVFLFRLAVHGIAPESPLGVAFYPVSALWRLLPWWPLMPAAVAAGWARARAGDRGASWALGFALVFFTAISLMRTKADHYALPLVLPLALLVAGWVEAPASSSRWDRASGWLCAGLGGLLLLGAAGASTGVVQLQAGQRWPAAALAALLGMGYVVSAPLVGRGNRHGWSVMALAAAVAYGVGGATLRPWDPEPALRKLAKVLPRDVEVGYVTEASVGADFCSYAALRFRLERPPQVFSPRTFAAAPSGWYAGRRGVLRPGPTDRVALDEAGWVLVHRP